MKTKLFLIIVAVAFAAGFKGCGGGFECPAGHSDAVCEAARRGDGVPTSRSFQQRTPSGAMVYGSAQVSTGQLALIDQGVNGAIADAGDYTEALSPTLYDVFTPPYECIPSPEQQVPSFVLRADSYDGTEFDQFNENGPRVKDGIGVIFAAELVLSLGTPGSTTRRGQMYVCPDASVLKDAVRHGAEHIIIANNDNAYYEQTWWHGNGFYHPLLPKRAGRGAGHKLLGGAGMAIEPVR